MLTAILAPDPAVWQSPAALDDLGAVNRALAIHGKGVDELTPPELPFDPPFRRRSASA